jgi:hypothetical protein
MSAKLSLAQIRMLQSVDDYSDPYHHLRGQSEHGGAHGTMRVLLNRKLITYPVRVGQRWILTRAGRKALREARR